jgi:ankyrin repeat protein
LLDAGADVNARDKLKKTALMQAAEQGHVNIVRALVLAGADINAIDCEGKNALSFALEISNSPVTRLLRSQGATELASADVGGGNQ